MKNLLCSRTLALAAYGFSLSLLNVGVAAGADTTAPIKWTARATSGQDVTVPVADHVTIVAFLRPAQQQSDDAAKQIADALAKTPEIKAIVIVSGATPSETVQKFIAADQIAFPVVVDPDYALSGKMSVNVWPTTVVVGSDGAIAAHLAGLPQSFASDLSAHLDFAAGKIDAAALAARLSKHEVIAESPEQMAALRLHMADALLARGELDQASSEIDAGLKLAPAERGLRVARVELLLKQQKNDAALPAAEELKDAVPSWQLNLLRAQALIGLERWPDAKVAATEALKLNPHPAQAYYLAGVIASHENDWQCAAEAFRKAYEVTPALETADTPASP